MDLNIIDTYGLPIAGLIVLGIALYKTVEFIQKQLLQQIEDRHNAEMEAIRQLEEEHKTFHAIIVTLIALFMIPDKKITTRQNQLSQSNNP